MVLLPVVAVSQDDFSHRPDLDPQDARSGFEFLQPETQALQLDEFANPGWLWVEAGRRQFESGCVSCHTEGASELRGAAARYPQVDAATGTLMNLERRVQSCQVDRGGADPLPDRSLLELSAYLTSLSAGQQKDVDISGEAAPFFARGRAYFFRRKGQLNLACNQCHDDHYGGLLRGDRLSQGHPNAFPAYRLEWQEMGSLHRRFQDCDVGVRAQPHPLGSDAYVELELYLAWRARTLQIEAPGVRR